jgi:short-subunit dehydrogenase involved in D-alanine esterification of teichoic acids
VDFTKGIAEFLAGENEIRINLEAPILLAGALVPHLTGKKGAAIVNVSSGLGFVPAARMPVYSASKAGMHAFSVSPSRTRQAVAPAHSSRRRARRRARARHLPASSAKNLPYLVR